MNFHCLLKLAIFSLLTNSFSVSVFSQQDRLEKALAIPTKQTGVEIDAPTADEMKNCTIGINETPPGFVVKDNTGRILRLFVDTNNDKKLDQWSFYKNGIEVYRDIDGDFDGKTDQYRWLGTGGTRWGLDPDQDDRINEWKIISAEEVAFEVFQAIKNQDQQRFQRVLVTPAEFKAMGLGTPIATEIQKRWKAAQQNFSEFSKTQKQISATTEWVHSSNGLPALIATGAFGNKQDSIVYDHASAVFKSQEYGQLSIGTIVQVGAGVWRAIELPEVAEEGKPILNGGAFFPMPETVVPGEIAQEVDPQDEKMAELYGKLEALEKELAAAEKPIDIARLEESKAKMLEQFYDLTKAGEQKLNWLKNIADSVASAYQKERFPDGLKFLDGYLSRLKTAGQQEGLDYIRWRAIYARYTLDTELGDSRKRDEANQALIDDLVVFQKEFTDSSLAAEALSALGVHFEISGEEKDAIEWYQQAVTRFAATDFGKRSAGALVRLSGQGKPMTLVGKDLKGTNFNLQDPQWRGKIVVIHFWETWCPDGLDEVQRLAEKYKEDVVFIGCNIDVETKTYQAYMQANPDFFTWQHLHAPGSLEKSPLAQQLGVPSEPLVLIVNKKGELAEPDVAFSDLEREIERQRRK